MCSCLSCFLRTHDFYVCKKPTEKKKKRYMYIKLNSNSSSIFMHPQAYFEIHHFFQKINQLYSYLNILILYDNLLQSCECIKTKK